MCGEFKFYIAVVGEKKSLCRGDLLLFHDKRVQILKGLPSWRACLPIVAPSGIVYCANSPDKSYGL